MKALTILSLALALVACESRTVLQPKPVTSQTTKPVTKPVPYSPSEGVRITPYQQAEIGRKNLLDVQNTAAQKNPAVFKQLMQNTINAYNAKRWSEAEQYALQAQRISPRAAETYLYLGLLAKQKGQFSNSSNLARQGLSYAQSDALHKQLWLLILQNAQQQNDVAVIKQAQMALRSL